MRKLTSVFCIILLISGCATQQIKSADMPKQYIPANIEITVADGITIPNVIIPAIRATIKEYVDDKRQWNEKAMPTNLLINIKGIDEASWGGVIAAGFISTPGLMEAELTIFDGDKKIILPVTAKIRSAPFTPIFFGTNGLNERLATSFALEIISRVQYPDYYKQPDH